MYIFYKKEFSHPQIPSSAFYRNIPLGWWANHQRTYQEKGTLSDERIALLENIGFIWDRIENNWNLKYENAKIFYEANGHLNVTRTQDPSLSRWLRRNRSEYSSNELDSKKIELLTCRNYSYNS